MSINPDEIMEALGDEIMSNLKAMAKSEELEDKVKYSKAIKNLCNSQAVYLGFMRDMAVIDDFAFEDDDRDTPF